MTQLLVPVLPTYPPKRVRRHPASIAAWHLCWPFVHSSAVASIGPMNRLHANQRPRLRRLPRRRLSILEAKVFHRLPQGGRPVVVLGSELPPSIEDAHPAGSGQSPLQACCYRPNRRSVGDHSQRPRTLVWRRNSTCSTSPVFLVRSPVRRVRQRGHRGRELCMASAGPRKTNAKAPPSQRIARGKRLEILGRRW